MSSVRPLLITMGDPAGIGPEIIVKAFAARDLVGTVVVGDAGVLQSAATRLAQHGHPAVAVVSAPSLEEAVRLNHMPSKAAQVHNEKRMVVWQVMPPLPEIPMGQVSAVAGQASVVAVERAAEAALAGLAEGLVTAPIHKQAWRAAGVMFPGHTELLQSLSARHLGCEVADVPVRMMLASPRLRVVLTTIHLALKDAIQALTPDLLLQTLRIAHADLSRELGRAPRLAVAGLNPHAGEGGQMGREEIDIIAPAIKVAKTEGLQVSGPLPSDTVFLQALDPGQHPDRFDAVVVMYHDQGLIPIKLLNFDEGVNVTLGLPLRRSSPDHGTAFDIAGTGLARPDSLLAAISHLALAQSDTIPGLTRS